MSNQMIRNKVKQGPSLVYPNVVVYFGSTSIFLNLRKKNRSSYCHLFSLIYIILEIFFFEVRSEIFDFTQDFFYEFHFFFFFLLQSKINRCRNTNNISVIKFISKKCVNGWSNGTYDAKKYKMSMISMVNRRLMTLITVIRKCRRRSKIK